MDIFGPAWTDHADRLRRNWDAVVGDTDIVLMPGDLSWAMRFPEALPDLEFIAERPGRKVLIRGNHDYWWHRDATNRIQREVNRGMTFLQGTAVEIGGAWVTGTRGWRIDRETQDRDEASEGTGKADSDRVLVRELAYLERGLKCIPEGAPLKIAMLHIPPFDESLQPNDFAHLLCEHSVDILVYGHVHLGLGEWLEGDVDGIRYHMVSADVVDFAPQLIVP